MSTKNDSFIHQGVPRHGHGKPFTITSTITFDEAGIRKIDRALREIREMVPPKGFPKSLPGSEVEITAALEEYRPG